MAAGGGDTRTFDRVDNVALHIIAIDNTSARTIPLPVNGVLHIGRSRDAEIAVSSDVVSRNHARLVVQNGRIQIEDLGSHNGTLVNGERIAGTALLAAGDVITVADTLLIVRGAGVSRPARAVGFDELAQRIDQEFARAIEYDRPFCLVVMIVARPRLREAIARVLAAARPMDVVCEHLDNILVLCPELETRAGNSHGLAMLGALGDPDVRGGVASYPHDGCDSAQLIEAARSAALVAPPGQLSSSSSTSIEHHVAGRRVIVADPTMHRIYDLIRRLAKSDIAVMITGETGSGKENAAAALHHWSPRVDGPFIALNCAAVPETLAESELFGHEKGAFSDAKTAKPGVFERAHSGTVFLDEVGDLSLVLQAKLLRALEQKRITRLGDTREREVDVRIVAATNADLDAAVASGRFRADLRFRISAATLELPPLRHRRQEIPLLARSFLQNETKRLGRNELDISEAALAVLIRHSFPGNVRELKNSIEYAVATSEGPLIQPWNLPPQISGASPDPAPAVHSRRFTSVSEELRDLERRRMVEALEAHDGIQTQAAAAIGMPLRTFTFRMRQYAIESQSRKR